MKRPHTLTAALTAASLLTTVATADVPDYQTFELQIRSNFTVNGPSFNIPGNTFFNSVTPSINDSQTVAVQLNIIAGETGEGFWTGTEAGGDIEYAAPDSGSISDVSINNLGDIVFEQSFTSADGLYKYDASDDTTTIETVMPFGASGWSSPTLNDSGEIGFRANFAGPHAFTSFDGVNSTATHAAEVNLDLSSPYSFIFTPSFNNNRQIASKVRLGAAGQTGGSQPDEIRLFNSDGTSTLIAEDEDGDISSPYDLFDNSPQTNDVGQVAFTANLVGGGRGVFLSDGTTTFTIATESDPMVSDIEFFSPTVNNNGLVVFRGEDASGLQALFAGDGTTLIRVIGEHDLIPTDLGMARIDQNDSSTVFGGAPRLNNNGDIVFSATLTPPDNDQIEWGSGIFVAVAPDPTIPGDITDSDGGGPDGVVDVFDLLLMLEQWNSAGPEADIAGDGTSEPDGIVDVFDLLVLLKNWS